MHDHASPATAPLCSVTSTGRRYRSVVDATCRFGHAHCRLLPGAWCRCQRSSPAPRRCHIGQRVAMVAGPAGRRDVGGGSFHPGPRGGAARPSGLPLSHAVHGVTGVLPSMLTGSRRRRRHPLAA